MSPRAKISAAWALAALLAAGTAQAQALRDPTRPPGAAVIRGAAGSSEGGDLVLQSVLVSPERRAAIISGRVVRLGESADGYRLIAVGESEAVIRVGTQSRTLRLYPAVDLGKAGKTGDEGADRQREDKKAPGGWAAGGG